jgi:hypothetical protein
LAAAKAQIEAAQAEEESEPPATRVKRTLEIDEKESGEEIHVKRTRVDDLERQIWYDDRRGRALLGLAIGLGARYALPSFPTFLPSAVHAILIPNFEFNINGSVVLPYLI